MLEVYLLFTLRLKCSSSSSNSGDVGSGMSLKSLLVSTKETALITSPESFFFKVFGL